MVGVERRVDRDPRGSGRPRICSSSAALPASSLNGSTFSREVSSVTCSTRSAMAWNSGLWMRMRRPPDMCTILSHTEVRAKLLGMTYRIAVTADGVDVESLAVMLDGVDGARTEVRRRRQDQLALDATSVEACSSAAMGTVNALIAAVATVWVARRPSAPQDRVVVRV